MTTLYNRAGVFLFDDQFHDNRVLGFGLVDEIRSPAVQEAIANIQERKELLSKAVRKGLGNGKMTPKDGLRAVDLLNQMEGIYVTKTESKNAVIVKLVIEEEDPSSVIEGEISPSDPPES